MALPHITPVSPVPGHAPDPTHVHPDDLAATLDGLYGTYRASDIRVRYVASAQQAGRQPAHWSALGLALKAAGAVPKRKAGTGARLWVVDPEKITIRGQRERKIDAVMGIDSTTADLTPDEQDRRNTAPPTITWEQARAGAYDDTGHPLQYATVEVAGRPFTVCGTERLSDDEIRHAAAKMRRVSADQVSFAGERFNRCPACDQWSPCDGRAAILAAVGGKDA